jgi:hypothetical protein
MPALKSTGNKLAVQRLIESLCIGFSIVVAATYVRRNRQFLLGEFYKLNYCHSDKYEYICQ